MACYRRPSRDTRREFGDVQVRRDARVETCIRGRTGMGVGTASWPKCPSAAALERTMGVHMAAAALSTDTELLLVADCARGARLSGVELAARSQS